MSKKLASHGLIVAILSILFFIIVSLFNNKSVPVQATYTEIHEVDLVNSITAKGAVESVNKHNIYTALNFRTKEIMVQTGDYVEDGQILCLLDTEDLELNIAQLKADLDVSQKNALAQYEKSKTIYEGSSAKMQVNENAQVLAASKALEASKTNLDSAQRIYNNLQQDSANNSSLQVETTRLNLENAQRAYDSAVQDYNNHTDATVMAAENALESAKLNLDAKKADYETNKVLYENDVIAKEAFTQYETLYKDASNKYNEAMDNLDTVKSAQNRALDQLKNALDTAQTSYNNSVTSQSRSLEQAGSDLTSAKMAYANAEAAYSSAVSAAEDDLRLSKSTLEGAEGSLNMDAKLLNIQKLEKQLDEATVKSPAAGTVTAIFAEKGSFANGLLFVVEDTEHLEISSFIKEYDYTKIRAGMDVIIRSDSTGDNEYSGVISKVDPAAAKNALGETKNSSDVEFGISIEITSPDTPLRIGMNTRLELILEKKTNVFGARYDAVAMTDKGQNIIFAATKSGSGYKLKPVVVDIGMSTDFYLEISSSELKDGMNIMNDAASIMETIKKLKKSPDKIDGLTFTLI